MQQLELADDEMKYVDEELKTIADKGSIPVDPNGVMPLDRYLDLQRAAMVCLAKIKNAKEKEQRDERLELLKKHKESQDQVDQERYKNLIKKHLQSD